ncbi:hypothetical protein ANAPC5_00357 [Anaplasma phagocytophilum]|nr:hypothetical protein ANAPC2_00989 [Anaplasma phagocytophilum]SCV62771.1 hypothetical protein ANAPC5_00357 [Anaplasma phagocytophilum]
MPGFFRLLRLRDKILVSTAGRCCVAIEVRYDNKICSKSHWVYACGKC